MFQYSTPHRPATGPAGRIYLDVPYADKDGAKALGARWDPAARRWFDLRPPTAGLDRWAGRPPVPDLLPWEDRTFGAGLFVDMVPSSCWFTNVRTCVSQLDWERLRRMITGRAGQRCEACGAAEDRAVARRLEAHERWAYHEWAGVQALRRLICLCTSMTAAQAWRHVAAAGEAWTARSGQVWTLDLSMLTDAGVTVARPGRAAERPAAARRALHHADQQPRVTRPRTAPPTAGRTPVPASEAQWVTVRGRLRRWIGE